MGVPQPGMPDAASGRVVVSFSAVGASPAMIGLGCVNYTISGTFVATVVVERSFDAGATWHAVFTADGLVPRIHTAPVSSWTFEGEQGMQYRVHCTAYTSGTVTCRLST